MKRHLLPLLLLAGAAGLLPAHRAQAQDKPVLNSAPPGAPATPRPTDPAPATQPAPTPAPAPEPTTAPQPQPTPDSPSGLNFPGRTGAQKNSGGNSDRNSTKKFIYTNFGLGLSSSEGLTRFNISGAPALGFRLTDKFAIGPGISYAYSNFSLSPDDFIRTYGVPYPTPNGSLTASGANSIATNSIGVKAFAQYIVYKEFFVHAEYEVTNAQILYEGDNYFLFKQNKTVSTPLAGIGYRSYIGEKAAFDIVGLYNFDNSIYSLYPGLVVRFSLLFNIGK